MPVAASARIYAQRLDRVLTSAIDSSANRKRVERWV